MQSLSADASNRFDFSLWFNKKRCWSPPNSTQSSLMTQKAGDGSLGLNHQQVYISSNILSSLTADTTYTGGAAFIYYNDLRTSCCVHWSHSQKIIPSRSQRMCPNEWTHSKSLCDVTRTEAFLFIHLFSLLQFSFTCPEWNFIYCIDPRRQLLTHSPEGSNNGAREQCVGANPQWCHW